MGLSSEQIERFYRIWFALLCFVNDQRQIISDFPISGEEGVLSPPDEMKLRNALKAKSTPTSCKRFIRFLAETERMEFEQTQALLQVLKQA